MLMKSSVIIYGM